MIHDHLFLNNDSISGRITTIAPYIRLAAVLQVALTLRTASIPVALFVHEQTVVRHSMLAIVQVAVLLFAHCKRPVRLQALSHIDHASEAIRSVDFQSRRIKIYYFIRYYHCR
jgi:hypothetical protein